MSTPLDTIISRLREPERQHDGAWMAYCPAHADGQKSGRRSLSVGTGADGRVLLHCYAGCEARDITAALRLGLGDLFADERPERPAVEKKGRPKRPRGLAPSHVFVFTDAAGAEVHRKERYEWTDDAGGRCKDFRALRPCTEAEAAAAQNTRESAPEERRKLLPYPTWVDGRRYLTGRGALDGIALQLYRLPAVVEAVAAGWRIAVTEGELKADDLQELADRAGWPIRATCHPGSASGRWTAEQVAVLAGADVVVLPDNDKPGRKYASSLAADLHAVGATVRVVEVPGLVAKEDIRDWLQRERAACRKAVDAAAEIQGWIDAVEPWAPPVGPSPAPGDERPTIIYRHGEEPDAADQAEAALLAYEPDIYHRADSLVCVVRDPETGCAILKGVQQYQLYDLMGRSARWLAQKKPTMPPAPCAPPMDIVRVLQQRTRWTHIRPCVGVVESPTLRPDLTILDVPGYDAASMLLYRPTHGVAWESVPAAPTKDDAEEGLAAIADVFREFPFRSGADMSVAMCLFITGLIRAAIPTAPLFVVTSSTPHTGKSLICRVAHMVATGYDWSPKNIINGDEFRKQLMATAMEGARFYLVDNLETGGQIRNPVLDAALTSPYMSDRVLGVSENRKFRLALTMAVSANNATIGGDLGRRTLQCELQTPMERPGDRPIQRKHLLGYVREHRPRLVRAVLTAIRAAHLADVSLTVRDTSFPEWDDVVRRPLVWAGYPDPLQTRERLQGEMDTDIADWGAFLRGWRVLFHDQSRTTAEALRALDADSRGPEERRARIGMRSALDSMTGGRAGDGRAVGAQFQKFRSRTVHGLRLVPAQRGASGMRWRCDVIDPQRYGAACEEDRAGDVAADDAEGTNVRDLFPGRSF